MYSALPKDYGECMVSEVGGIRLLVVNVCILKSSSCQIYKQCVVYYNHLQLCYSGAKVSGCKVGGNFPGLLQAH